MTKKRFPVTYLENPSRDPAGLKVYKRGSLVYGNLLANKLPSLGETPDAISVLAYPDEELVTDQEGSITAFMPPSRANEPPTGVSEPQREVSKPSNENVIQANGTTETAQRMAVIFMIRTLKTLRGNKKRFLYRKTSV